jgi:hypothetical protein
MINRTAFTLAQIGTMNAYLSTLSEAQLVRLVKVGF